MSNVTDFPRMNVEPDTDQNETLFGEWLTLRAHRYVDRPSASMEDELASERQKEDVARRVAFMPTQSPHRILHKIQMLEAELLDMELGGNRTIHALVAGIKADIQDLAEAAE